MTRPKSAIRPALLAAALLVFTAPSSAGESRKVAVDASEIRIAYPQVFRSDADWAQKSSSGASAGSVQSPFAMPPPPAYRDLQLGSTGGRGLRGGCDVSASDLCHDLVEGRIVYRPARQYMPRFEGLTAESISVRRNGIRLRYSFR